MLKMILTFLDMYVLCFAAPALFLNKNHCYSRILTLMYTILMDLQQARRLLVTTVCVRTAANAWGRSVIAPTWSLMSLLKHLHREY